LFVADQLPHGFSMCCYMPNFYEELVKARLDSTNSKQKKEELIYNFSS